VRSLIVENAWHVTLPQYGDLALFLPFATYL